MDSKTFLDLLKQSGLLTDEQIVDAVRRFGGSSTERVSSSLVSEGLLTPFQVKRLTAGQTKGLVLGQYRILDELGSGGFGQVFRALHTVMGRTVAVKVIAPELVEDSRARTWFKREVLAITQLCHPNIVMAYDANEAEGLLFLVMEFVDGADLESVVCTQGPLAINAAYELMRQAGLALQYAHERGMVHRDIKPANLLIPKAAVGPAGPVVVKVTDFGLARLHSSVPGHSVKTIGENGFLGTPAYVSPEQARNAGKADIRSDLYSLGCTFYYALAGRKPFVGTSAVETLMMHLEEEATPLEALRPEVPSGVAAVVRRLMAKDPAKRFQTPAELVSELTFLSARGDDPAPRRRPLPGPPAGAATGEAVDAGRHAGVCSGRAAGIWRGRRGNRRPRPRHREHAHRGGHRYGRSRPRPRRRKYPHRGGHQSGDGPAVRRKHLETLQREPRRRAGRPRTPVSTRQAARRPPRHGGTAHERDAHVRQPD